MGLLTLAAAALLMVNLPCGFKSAMTSGGVGCLSFSILCKSRGPLVGCVTGVIDRGKEDSLAGISPLRLNRKANLL